MKRRLGFICLMLFVCLLSCAGVGVEEKKVDYSKEVELFIQVVSNGEAKKDPLIMISAVRMLDALPFDSITDEGTGVRYEREALLNKAREYASGDKEVLAMIEKVEEEKVALRGPQREYHHPHPPGGPHPPPHPPEGSPQPPHPPEGPHPHPPGATGGGCFIATAAYGSPIREEVSTLREFRDRYLLTHTPGKILVKVYYAVSPPLADLVARHESLKVLTRGALYPVVGISRYLLKDSAGFVLSGAGLLLVGLLLAWCVRHQQGKDKLR